MKTEKIDNTVYCETCGAYANPRVIRKYTDNDDLGWVTCAHGNTIRRKSMACGKHTSGKAMTVREPVQQISKEPELADLLGGVDFENMLQNEINKIGARV